MVFILIQTGRHRDLFVHGPIEEHDVPDPTAKEIGKWVAMLVAGALPIVLLSKSLDKVVDDRSRRSGAPGGAHRRPDRADRRSRPRASARSRPRPRNQLQRTVNLCLGACLSTLGLTLPAPSLITGRAR